jgi:hypothetical protein
MAKPAELPRWAQTALGALAANISDPVSGKKDTGFILNEVPTSGNTNWFWNTVYQWIKWLDSILDANGLIRRPAQVRHIPISDGQIVVGAAGSTVLFAGPGVDTADFLSSTVVYRFPIVLGEGELLSRVVLRAQCNLVDTVTLKVWKQDLTGVSTSGAQLGSTATSAGHAFALETVDCGVIAEGATAALVTYFADVTCVYGGGAGPRISGLFVTTAFPGA